MISERYRADGQATLVLNTLQQKTKQQLQDKISSGTYNYETLSACPLCTETEHTVLAKKDRYGINNEIACCQGCGLVMTNPRMTQEAYSQFYNYEQKKLYVGEERPSTSYFERQTQKGKDIYEFIARQQLVSSDKKMKVLEVGCGAGGILAYFKSQGHEVMGLDIGTTYIDFGKEKGLNIRDGFLKDLETGTKYDIIIYSHVMEHILDVKAELEQIKKYMHADSVLYIEVPGVKNVYKNYKMDYLKYFQSAHTFHFSLDSLRNWLTISGYKMVVGTEFVQSLFKLTDNNLTTKDAITNDYAPVMKHIKRVDTFRFLYPLSPYFFRMKLTGLLQKINK